MDKTNFQIFEDFSESLLDILETNEKITGDFKRINQLLFSHLINNFTSFIESLNWKVLILKPKKLEEYFFKTKNKDSNIKIKELIDIEKIWLQKWKESIAQRYYKWELSNKTWYEKVKQLLENLWIEANKYYVCLSWGWKNLWYQSGFIRPKENQLRKAINPSWIRKKTLNHDTGSDNLLWFIDIFYEKRNAVTHNKWKYKDIEKINKNWKLKIKSDSVLIKKTSIKSIIRFWCSFSIMLIEEFIENNNHKDKLKLVFKNISHLEKVRAGKLDKYAIRRDEILEKQKWKTFSKKEYEKYFNISSASASRDIKKYKEDILFTVNQSGRWASYNILIK